MNEQMDAPGLLQAAARLVEQALLKLDVRTAPCDCCGMTLFSNKLHGRAQEQLANTAERLRTVAGKLKEDAGQPGAGDPSPGYVAAAARFHGRGRRR